MGHRRIASAIVAMFYLLGCSRHSAPEVGEVDEPPKVSQQADVVSPQKPPVGESPQVPDSEKLSPEAHRLLGPGGRRQFTRLEWKLEWTDHLSFDGRAPTFTIEASGNVSIHGSDVDMLTPAELGHLHALYEAVDWEAIENDKKSVRFPGEDPNMQYYRADATDGTTTTLTVRIGRRTISVSVYMVGLAGEPPELTALLKYIKSLFASRGY